MIDKEDGDKTRIPVPGGKDMMASEIAEWLEDYLKKNPKALTEDLDEATFAQHMKKAIASKERGDEKKTLYHLGNAKTARYAMKSTEISKNKDLLDKYKEMTKNLSESEFGELDEGVDIPRNIKIGDVVKTNEGTLKILDITISSLNLKDPSVYIYYEYDVIINGKKLKDKEKQELKFFKKMFQ
jgi:hypothetical protein